MGQDSMFRKLTPTTIAAIIIVGLATLASPFVFGFWSDKPHFATRTAPSNLLLSDKDGHGSGVYIGGGFVLTAAHVPGEEKTMDAKAEDGSTRTATVLWSNHLYDVALMHIDDGSHFEVSPLSCAPTVVGQHVRSFGNPSDLEFVWTSGEVIGEPRKIFEAWAEAVPVDMTIIPGQSGGGVLDDDGQVVGIAVGVMTADMQTGYGMYSTSVTGIGYIVPSTTICMLLART
jgi:S1-C subfamily serine protease